MAALREMPVSRAVPRQTWEGMPGDESLWHVESGQPAQRPDLILGRGHMGASARGGSSAVQCCALQSGRQGDAVERGIWHAKLKGEPNHYTLP